jgi:hypothetical protein
MSVLKTINKWNGNLLFAATNEPFDYIVECDRFNKTLSYSETLKKVKDVCLYKNDSYLVTFATSKLGLYKNGILNENLFSTNVTYLYNFIKGENCFYATDNVNDILYKLDITFNTVWELSLPESHVLSRQLKYVFEDRMIYYDGFYLYNILDEDSKGIITNKVYVGNNFEFDVQDDVSESYTYFRYIQYQEDFSSSSSSESSSSYSSSSSTSLSSSSSSSLGSSSSSSSLGTSSSSSLGTSSSSSYDSRDSSTSSSSSSLQDSSSSSSSSSSSLGTSSSSSLGSSSSSSNELDICLDSPYLFPSLTSNITPGSPYRAWDGSNPSGLSTAYRAFDHDLETQAIYLNDYILITVNLNDPDSWKVVNGYLLDCQGGTPNISNVPVSWRFQASNNGINWTTLDTRINEWGDQDTRRRCFFNINPQNRSYRYYRLVFDDKLWEEDSPVNYGIVELKLISNFYNCNSFSFDTYPYTNRDVGELLSEMVPSPENVDWIRNFSITSGNLSSNNSYQGDLIWSIEPIFYPPESPIQNGSKIELWKPFYNFGNYGKSSLIASAIFEGWPSYGMPGHGWYTVTLNEENESGIQMQFEINTQVLAYTYQNHAVILYCETNT